MVGPSFGTVATQIILARYPHKTPLREVYQSCDFRKLDKNPKFTSWKWWKSQVPILIFLGAHGNGGFPGHYRARRRYDQWRWGLSQANGSKVTEPFHPSTRGMFQMMFRTWPFQMFFVEQTWCDENLMLRRRTMQGWSLSSQVLRSYNFLYTSWKLTKWPNLNYMKQLQVKNSNSSRFQFRAMTNYVFLHGVFCA